MGSPNFSSLYQKLNNKRIKKVAMVQLVCSLLTIRFYVRTALILILRYLKMSVVIKYKMYICLSESKPLVNLFKT